MKRIKLKNKVLRQYDIPEDGDCKKCMVSTAPSIFQDYKFLCVPFLQHLKVRINTNRHYGLFGCDYDIIQCDECKKFLKRNKHG